jgi:hypothetical protein
MLQVPTNGFKIGQKSMQDSHLGSKVNDSNNGEESYS